MPPLLQLLQLRNLACLFPRWSVPAVVHDQVYPRDMVLMATVGRHAIIESMPVNGRMPVSWSRRSVLVALAAGSLTALSGCGVRLEEDAPQLPLVPTREPMKDEKALLAVLSRSASLGSLATSVGGVPTSLTARLSALHATQVAVVTRLLRDGGVPESLIVPAPPNRTTPAPTPSAPASATASRTASSRVTAAALSAAERSSMSDVSPADLSNAHVALIGALLAQRAAAVSLLGGAAVRVVPSGLKGAEAVRLLATTRASVYGFQVIAAQIDNPGRALAMSTLASLEARASQLQAAVGSTGAPRPLGYRLPFPVTDAGSARRLALRLLASQLTSQAAALDPATGDPAALATIVQWLGETEAVASRWGAPLSAFPGLTTG